MLCNGVLDAVGNTPLVRLSRLFLPAPLTLYGKLEGSNPGGSIKDRPAWAILEAAIHAGEVTPGTVVVESSSGNMGVGLAQACAYHRLPFICVVDAKSAPQNLRIIEVYGGRIDYVATPDPETGEFLQARLRRVQELIAALPEAFWPNQYANSNNPSSHYRTMREVVQDLGEVDYLFAATSTCGTIRGCADYIRHHGLKTKVVAVDAVGSMIFSDRKGPRHIPGLGAGLRPTLCDLSLIDETVHVTDADCVAGCRRLVALEAILAGGSSGGVVAAVHKLAPSIPRGATCVAILCDRGERYLDTVYDDRWVAAHCGPLPAWELQPEAEIVAEEPVWAVA